MKCLTGLYKHQEDAVNKLLHIRVGALYMEMGTGKTRTALEIIKRRVDDGKLDQVIWLCPCSVKINLRRDIIKHCGSIPSFFSICGIETLSTSVSENSRLLTLANSSTCMLIVDESNMVKNPQAKRTKNIIRISKECRYKMILNGTPISRSEVDLFSQWYILDWRILGYRSWFSFAANHVEYDELIPGKIRNCLNVDYLAEKIDPYCFQVKKDECLDLPDKTYETEYYYMTDSQTIHYGLVAEYLIDLIDQQKPNTIYRLFSALQTIISGNKIESLKMPMSTKPFFESEKDNPRIVKLLDILDTIDGKVIIYCKYTREITSIVKIINERYGNDMAVPFFGQISQKERQKNIDAFEKTARFLVANKQCAGYGLNLQFCSYIIYYNNDWDYATRVQSEDRVHRIGQSKNVHIIDICAEESLDVRILDCLTKKENMVETFKSELDFLKSNEDTRNWINGKSNIEKKVS